MLRENECTSLGITPACAGKSTSFLLKRRKPQDHPRVCGEKIASHDITIGHKGSPPRVRGKVEAALEGIPLDEDHPRVCGEKLLRFVQCRPFEGSPPRVRGKDFPTISSPRALGITPACAGKSRSKPPGKIGGRDHPRVCGEKTSDDSDMMIEAGSPPRVRGKGTGTNCRLSAPRITPACAGKRSGL